MAFFTDTENRVYEHEAEDNNFTIVPNIAITRNPDNLPELAISDVTLTNLLAGDTLRVSYKVTNLSGAETSAAYWTDKLIISNPAEKVVLTKISLINRTLAKNESYIQTMNVFVPIRLSGEFKLRLVADFDHDVQEYDDENNIHEEDIVIGLSKWADLILSEVNYPEVLTAGKPALPGKFRTMETGIQKVAFGLTECIYLKIIFLTSRMSPFLKNPGIKYFRSEKAIWQIQAFVFPPTYREFII